MGRGRRIPLSNWFGILNAPRPPAILASDRETSPTGSRSVACKASATEAPLLRFHAMTESPATTMRAPSGTLRPQAANRQRVKSVQRVMMFELAHMILRSRQPERAAGTRSFATCDGGEATSQQRLAPNQTVCSGAQVKTADWCQTDPQRSPPSPRAARIGWRS